MLANIPSQFLLNVSTNGIYIWDAEGARPSYGLTKGSGTLLVQQIAKDVKPETMQIISFHPGEVFSESAKRQGYTEDSIEWYDGKMYPGPKFAVPIFNILFQGTWLDSFLSGLLLDKPRLCMVALYSLLGMSMTCSPKSFRSASRIPTT